MYKSILLVAFICAMTSVQAQKVPSIGYDELTSKIDQSESEIIAVNFWATWCGPCIKELPYFEAVNKRDDVEVILVSLDFPEEMPKVEKIVAKKNLQSSVVLLNEKDYDSYMRKVDENWSGAIPATLFLDKSRKRYFYESAFSADELASVINKLKTKS